MNKELQKKIGHLFVCGFGGKEPDEQSRFLLKELFVSNWILFSRNIENYDQTKSLCKQLIQDSQLYTSFHPIISIDQEGGIVSRLHGNLNSFPGAMAVAATGDEDAARLAAYISARHLRYLNFNMNLAPVCDINSNPANPIIGPRSYGDRPETVSHFAAAAMQGYMDGGIVPVIKHFPGHGDTSIDSHNEQPILSHSRNVLEERELQPFRHCIAQGAPAVMLSHILLPALKTSMPASLSKEVVEGLLRSECTFRGLVLTDCLEMKGVRNHFTTAEAVILAVKAGADLIFISHTAEEQEEGFIALYDAVVSGEISESRIDSSLLRIQKIMETYSTQPENNTRTYGTWTFENTSATQWEQDESGKKPIIPNPDLVEISRRSITLVRDRAFLSHHLAGNSLILVLERPESFIGESSTSGERPMNRIKDAFPDCAFATVSVDSQPETILSFAKVGYAHILIISCDSGFYPGAVEAIQTLCGSDASVGIAVMRSPYEASLFAKADFIVLSYEDTYLAVDNLIDLLRGKLSAEGKCPVTIPGLDLRSDSLQ